MLINRHENNKMQNYERSEFNCMKGPSKQMEIVPFYKFLVDLFGESSPAWKCVWS